MWTRTTGAASAPNLKVGFRSEGLLRKQCYAEGRYHNTLLMAVLRREWQARKSRRPQPLGWPNTRSPMR